DGNYFNEIVDNLVNSDPFMVCADFDSYHNAQVELQRIYANRMRWAKMSLMNIANAGMFSADRAIEDYAQNIWHLQKVK
ncbi:MAG: glycogen/starch/alpha-glucan phosphorylase, partial [Ruminococcaceae bacterium]|nr:glycogen/starch/alpha-glucan phosphorylase [Oscillospiraceae bacterium]